jgi:DNA repair exonuclease SbcCD ATPase subunit
MQSRHKDKVKDARTQERIFAQQADKARQELSTYEGLDELEQRVVEVTRAYESLTTQLQRAERLYEEAVRLERQMASAMELADRTEALRPLEPPPSQHDVVSLEAHCRRQQDRERTVQRELARSQAMDALQPPPPLEDEVHLRTVVDVVARRSQYVERMRRKLALTADLPQPPELSDLQPLRQVVQSMERQAQQVAGAKSRHADAEAALVAGRRLIDEYVGAHPTCPVCGGRLTAEQVIAGGADA